jgi:hypothetical protein
MLQLTGEDLLARPHAAGADIAVVCMGAPGVPD